MTLCYIPPEAEELDKYICTSTYSVVVVVAISIIFCFIYIFRISLLEFSPSAENDVSIHR